MNDALHHADPDDTPLRRATGCGPDVVAWAGRGHLRRLAGHTVFVVDVPPTDPDPELEPLLVVHGFPTSSLDWAGLVDRLAARRRVVTLDLLGFGLSDKPDVNYTMGLQADLVVELTAELGLDRLALVTHDMGDTVGGELLARNLEGAWPVEVTRRVVTNGSIYIDMAQLTLGQQVLLSMPDERVADGPAPDASALAASLHATLSPTTGLTVDDLLPHGELVVALDGARVLPRSIRYIEERRANERRFTGAIEAHPSPVTVVWGTDDPIAVEAMAHELRLARPDAEVVLLEGIGHYPMLEAPDAVAAAIEGALG